MASRCRCWPLPPWTASPAGLSMAITASSWNSTDARKASRSRGSSAGATRLAAVPGSGGVNGGTRTTWPAASRVPDLAGREPGARLGALAVDPDLAGAQQLLQAAVAEAGIMLAEPAVETQLRLLRRDGDGAHRGHDSATRVSRMPAKMPASDSSTEASA